jgi:hypothetical protein
VTGEKGRELWAELWKAVGKRQGEVAAREAVRGDGRMEITLDGTVCDWEWRGVEERVRLTVVVEESGRWEQVGAGEVVVWLTEALAAIR